MENEQEINVGDLVNIPMAPGWHQYGICRVVEIKGDIAFVEHKKGYAPSEHLISSLTKRES